MKIRAALYYILFLLLILGGFASMARNDYGLFLVSVCCYAFGISFLIELVLSNTKKNIFQIVEHISLILIFVLFGFRAAYIYLPFLEYVVIVSCLLLILSNINFARVSIVDVYPKNKQFGLLMISYFSGIILFLLSIMLRPLATVLSEILGMAGGGLLGIFILGVLFRRIQLLDGNETDILKYVRKQRNHSSLLATGFLIMSMYVGLNMINLLPPLYTEEVPEAYIELVNQAESGNEELTDGDYKHNRFKEEMDKFLDRNRDFVK